MGSDSDEVMEQIQKMLEKLGIDYDDDHFIREPDVFFFEWAKAAEGKGIKVTHCRAQVWRRIFRECARRCFRCRAGRRSDVRKNLAARTHCFQSR